MTPATYYRSSLAAPIAFPFLLLPLGIGAVNGLLLLALAFGGIQYVFFAAWMFIAIGRRRDLERIQELTYLAPVLFLPLQAFGWVAWKYYQGLSNPNLTDGIWEPLLLFAFYTVVVGYAYVIAVNCLFVVLRKIEFVRDDCTGRI